LGDSAHRETERFQTQTESATVRTAAKFTVAAGGTPPLTYQWHENFAANHLTWPNDQNCGNYSFHLAQSTLLKILTFILARAYIFFGAPLYVQVKLDSRTIVALYRNCTGVRRAAAADVRLGLACRHTRLDLFQMGGRHPLCDC